MKFLFNTIFLLTIFTSCKQNKIETANTLNDKDYLLISSLNLLDKDEKVEKFYSEYRKHLAGNFYTNKRLAKYWIDENDKSKNTIEFAYYKDILNLDTVFNAGLTYCPFILVTKKDSSRFKVCVEGTKNQVNEFFQGAIDNWKKQKE